MPVGTNCVRLLKGREEAIFTWRYGVAFVGARDLRVRATKGAHGALRGVPAQGVDAYWPAPLSRGVALQATGGYRPIAAQGATAPFSHSLYFR